MSDLLPSTLSKDKSQYPFGGPASLYQPFYLKLVDSLQKIPQEQAVVTNKHKESGAIENNLVPYMQHEVNLETASTSNSCFTKFHDTPANSSSETEITNHSKPFVWVSEMEIPFDQSTSEPEFNTNIVSQPLHSSSKENEITEDHVISELYFDLEETLPPDVPETSSALICDTTISKISMNLAQHCNSSRLPQFTAELSTDIISLDHVEALLDPPFTVSLPPSTHKSSTFQGVTTTMTDSSLIYLPKEDSPPIVQLVPQTSQPNIPGDSQPNIPGDSQPNIPGDSQPNCEPKKIILRAASQIPPVPQNHFSFDPSLWSTNQPQHHHQQPASTLPVCPHCHTCISPSTISPSFLPSSPNTRTMGQEMGISLDPPPPPPPLPSDLLNPTGQKLKLTRRRSLQPGDVVSLDPKRTPWSYAPDKKAIEEQSMRIRQKFVEIRVGLDDILRLFSTTFQSYEKILKKGKRSQHSLPGVQRLDWVTN